MSLIDSEGRLFGKVNAIDALTAIVLVAALFYAIYFLWPREPDYLYVTIKMQNKPAWYVEALKIGDYAGLADSKTAVLTDFKVLDRGGQAVRDVFAKFRVIVEYKKNKRHYGEFPLAMGRDITIDTIKMSFNGTISNIEEDNPAIEEQEVEKIVTIMVPGLPFWKLERLEAGMVEKTPQGKTIAEITDIEVLKKTPDSRANVMMKVKVLTGLIDNAFYFKERELLLESGLDMKLENIQFGGSILDIQEAVQENREIMVIDTEKIIEVFATKLNAGTVKSLTVGDKEIDFERGLVAELIDIISFGSGSSQSATLRLKAKCQQIKNSLYFKGNMITIGSAIEFSGPQAQVKGGITAIYDAGTVLPPLEEDQNLLGKEPGLEEGIVKILTIKASSIEAFVANEIPIKAIRTDDETGEALLEILSKKIEPAEVIFRFEKSIIRTTHPTLKDVTLKARAVVAKNKKNEFLFEENKVKVGGNFTIDAPTVQVTGKIVSIESG